MGGARAGAGRELVAAAGASGGSRRRSGRRGRRRGAGRAARGPSPGIAELLAVAAIGVAVAALWGVIGAGLGTLLANQVGARSRCPAYLQVGELVLAAALKNSGSPAAARLTPCLPGNAGDVAIWTSPTTRWPASAFGDRSATRSSSSWPG